ncbi:FAD-binding protein [Halobium salinum]|uniref:FAD-binding protein n=1 Tax=Halobium salinum TaxID=1364940 RepID=A0ABD5P7D5_9EURY|nr:FAD-binding protein [Halobium salinum]
MSGRSESDIEWNGASTTGVREVLVVGGGVAGLTAALFTARAGLDTLVVNHGESILRRNAHLENFPGFPAGVNPRLFADMLEAQTTRNGVDHRTGRVAGLEHFESADGEGDGASGDDASGPGFVATVGSAEGDDTHEVAAERVVVASWSDVDYLDGLDVDLREAGSKTYVDEDGFGRTSVAGLYVAGRSAERYHQAIVSAGHGAEVGITLVHDSETPFYHDWVTPEGYFTDRGREVPPGCEEVSETERRARERESMAAMREYFSELHAERQRTHPSLVEDEVGRVEEE